ncbi:MAG: fused response regulator/phosphatase [Gammaproteobacteria bacterium]
MHILVVDDTEANRKLLAWILEDEGHSVSEAKDGRQAVDLFMSAEYDLVLMDVMMPVMDGLEATKAIREYLGDKHVPIIFLTALSDDASLAKCLAIGGDDFLSKPINEKILQAKIKAHSRIKELNVQLNRQNQELKRLHLLTVREHEIAKAVFDNALASSQLDCGNIRQYISPAATFNGDLLLVSVSPSGGLYALLADFTGHGLPAAIGAIPLSQTFFDAAQQGASVSSIARALNRVLSRFLPNDMFAAAAIAELNADGNRLSLWMGGMPDALLTHPDGTLREKIISTHMPLGILTDDEFERDPHIFEVRPGERLYLYTDGIPEALNPHGELYGDERLTSHFNPLNTDPFTSLIDDVSQYRGAGGQIDDITLLELTCRPVDISHEENAEVAPNCHLHPWRIDMQLDASNLRNGSPVSQLIDMLGTSPALERHKDYLHTIITELFSNALEHGVLELSSDLKKTEDGYLEYYEQREQRLQTLEQGYVNIRLGLECEGNKGRLSINIEDSGKGFDIEQRQPSEDDDAFGRGIPLLETLCTSITYSNGGTNVSVEYLID